MDKLDMFQEKYGKVYEFGWWYTERIQIDTGTHFTYNDFSKVFLYMGYDFH